MYASNEDEDWVYLHQTRSPNAVFSGAINLMNFRSSSSSSSQSEDEEIQSNSSLTTKIDPPSFVQKDFSIHSNNPPLPTRCESVPSFRRHSYCGHSIPAASSINARQCPANRYETLISSAFMIILVLVPFILGHVFARWDQPVIDKIVKDLHRMNQRLNGLEDISAGHIEEILRIKLEEKFQLILRQRLNLFDEETQTLSKQVQELRNTLQLTRENLTDTINQLTIENHRLHAQVQSFERRFPASEEKEEVENSTDRCTETPLNKWIKTFFQQMSSSTVERVQTKIRQSVENLSSEFRRTKTHYFNWFQRREQTMTKNPCRWNFLRHRSSAYDDQQCHSKFSFRKWLKKFF